MFWNLTKCGSVVSVKLLLFFCFFLSMWNVCKNGFNDHFDLKKLLWTTSKTQCNALHRHLAFLPLPNSHWSGHKNPRQKDEVLLKVKVQTQRNNLLAPVLFHFSAYTLLCTWLQLLLLDIKAQKRLHNLCLINKVHAHIWATRATASHRSVLRRAAVTITHLSSLPSDIWPQKSWTTP